MLVSFLKEELIMSRDEVLTVLYGSKFWKDIEPIFLSEAKKVKTLKQQSEFFSKWSVFLWFDSKYNTIKNRSLQLRKSLIKKGGFDEDNHLVNAFKLPTLLHKQKNDEYSEKIKDKLNNLSNDKNYLEIAESILKDLIENIKSGDVLNISNNSKKSRELAYQKLIVLAVATGRRQIELLKTLEISKKKDLAEYKNLAKKKSSDNDSVVAPILIDVHIAKKYLKDVRKEFQTENMDNKSINSKYNNSIKKALFRYLDKDIAEKGFHFLRTLYAEACYQKFNVKEDKNLYFTKILGHEFKVNSAHSYQTK